MNKNGDLSVLIAVLIWSLSGLLIKSVEANALWITLIRSLAGGIVLFPYIFKEKIYPIKYVFGAGIFMAIFLFAMILTTKISSAAMGISMQYTAPIYMIAYNVYKNKRISVSKLIIFLFILIGITLNISGSIEGKSKIVILTGIITGLSFVFYSVNLQKIQKGNPLGLIAFVNIIAAGFCGLILLFRYTAAPKSITDITVLVLSGIIISGLSYSYYVKGLRRIPIERALIICLIEPVLNPVWVYLGKGEIPSKTVIVGIAFILCGTLIDLSIETYKKRKNENF